MGMMEQGHWLGSLQQELEKQLYAALGNMVLAGAVLGVTGASPTSCWLTLEVTCIQFLYVSGDPVSLCPRPLLYLQSKLDLLDNYHSNNSQDG